MNRIREIIEAKNMTIKGTAKAARVSRSYLYELMNGTKTPTISLAKRIAKATKSSLDELFPDYEEFQTALNQKTETS